MISDIYRSEHILEASGITIAPRLRCHAIASASDLPHPATMPTRRQRRLPSKSESGTNGSSEDDNDDDDDEDKNSNEDMKHGMLLLS